MTVDKYGSAKLVMASPTPYSEPLKPALYQHLPSIKQLVSKAKVVPFETENPITTTALQSSNVAGLKDISTGEKDSSSGACPPTEDAKIPVQVPASEDGGAMLARLPEPAAEKEGLTTNAAPLPESLPQRTPGAEARSHDVETDKLPASGSNSGELTTTTTEMVCLPAGISEELKQIVSVPRISPEEWLHLFQTTGLCQVSRGSLIEALKLVTQSCFVQLLKD